jgi:hypothetical protein
VQWLKRRQLPALAKSHEETKVPARIINVSSSGHTFAPGNGMDFVSLKAGPERDAWVKKKGSFMAPWYTFPLFPQSNSSC